ncbi:MAG: UMP kinase [Parcubacteria group bacterium]
MSIRKTVILSLGGSIIIPKKISVAYLKKFRLLILDLCKHGYRFVIVAGGGNVCRDYQKAAKGIASITADDLDWIGIAATKLNAELIRSLFGSSAYHEVLANPTKRIVSEKKILVGAGWKPGSSSDKDAVMLAHAYGAEMVVNMSNIEYVYTADPRKVKTARSIPRMTWDELLKLTGTKHTPGYHVPFDPEASKLAKQLGLTIVVCKGADLRNLRQVITGGPFTGTVIS